MVCQVRIPTLLRRHTGGAATVRVEGECTRVRDALAALESRYPAIADRLFDSRGRLRTQLIVCMNNEDIRYLSGLDTPLRDGDTVVLLPALGSGS